MPLDFEFTEEQKMFREAVREWCSKNLTLEKVREIDNTCRIPREVIKGLADLGLLVMTAREDVGGANADWVTTVIAAEELGYADISLAVPVFFLVQAGWGFVVDRYASEEVRQDYVARAIRGEGFVGIASTEPGGGSDVASFKSTAVRKNGKWVLNGEKTYISGTEEAKELNGGYFTPVYTDREKGHRGMTAFFLPINAPGVEVVKRFEDMGRMGISTGGFVMKDVELTDEYVIGEPGRGFYLTMEGFDCARLLVAATCVGAATRALELGIDWVKQRVVFGRPLGKFEGIQFELADLWTEVQATRWLIYRAAWMMDKRYKEGKFSPLETCYWVSMCKLKAPLLAFEVFKRVIIWHGAYGYTKECPLEMGLRGVLSYCVGAEGGQNIQRLVIARQLLGKEYLPYR